MFTRASAPRVSRSSTSSAFLDLARALAAIGVLLSHVKVDLFTPYSAAEHHGAATAVLYAVCTRGYQCVMVFFVLSGYLISSSTIRAMYRQQWSWRHYLIDRLTRLWTVLLPALVLIALWDHAGRLAFGVRAQDAGLLSFLGNLAFLQGVLVRNYGGDSPLWSLAYEFWYYIIFPCVALTFLSDTRTKRMAYAIASFALLAFVGKQIALYFLVWLLGFVPVLLANSRLPDVCRRWRAVLLPLTASLFIGVLFSRGVNDIQAFGYDFAVGATFAAIVGVVVFGFNEAWQGGRGLFPRTAALFAGFSYTLYLCHYPVLGFIQAAVHGSRLQPTPRGLVLAGLIVLAVLAYAWAVSLATEAQTAKLRALFVRLLIPAAPTAQTLPAPVGERRWKVESV